jgi:hypothetical protein
MKKEHRRGSGWVQETENRPDPAQKVRLPIGTRAHHHQLDIFLFQVLAHDPWERAPITMDLELDASLPQ